MRLILLWHQKLDKESAWLKNYKPNSFKQRSKCFKQNVNKRNLAMYEMIICHIRVRFNSSMQDGCISYLCCIENKMTILKNRGLKQQFIISQNASGQLGWSCLGHLHGCHQLGAQLGVSVLRWPHSHIWDLIWDSGPLSPWGLSSWPFPCLGEHSKKERTKEQSLLRPRLRNHSVFLLLHSSPTKHKAGVDSRGWMAKSHGKGVWRIYTIQY